MQQKLESVKSAMTDQMNQFNDEMEKAQEEIATNIQGMADEFTRLHEDFGTNLTDVSTNVVKAGTDDLQEQAEQQIEVELKELIEAAVKQLTDTIGVMSDKIADSESEASDARDPLEPLFDEIAGFINPLENGIEGVKQAADSVGVAFG